MKEVTPTSIPLTAWTTQFLLFTKLAELLRSHEARIVKLEEQMTGYPTDLSETTEEMNQLLKKLPGVHFPDPNCDRKDSRLKNFVEDIQEGMPDV